MHSNRSTARIVGALFLIAMVASLLGAALIEGVLGDANYLTAISDKWMQVRWGVFLELVNGLAVVSIAVMMFPLFRKHDEALALGYVGFRILEAMAIIGAVISPLTLTALSGELGAAGAQGLQAMGASLLAERGIWVGQLTGIFFGLAALLFYYLLYRSRLVPRWLSVWGLIAAVLVLAWNLLEFFGISVSIGMVLALPIIVNEVLLGIWLLVKGFSSPADASN